MRWLTETLAVLALNLRTIPGRLSSSAVADRRHRRRRGRVRVGAVDRRGVLGGDAGIRARSSRALVMRSGADSEMTSGLDGHEVDVIKQAPGIRRDGQTPRGLGRALRHHRSAEEGDARQAGERADARHRARGHGGARRSCRSSRAGCSSSAPTR